MIKKIREENARVAGSGDADGLAVIRDREAWNA
jgi:hypothetical protein